ncbi:MAG: hypothetical protein U0T83_06300 [Bacteriovoracaceae bacterium]
MLALVAKYVADKNKDFAKTQESKGFPITGYLFDVDKMGMLIISFVGSPLLLEFLGWMDF